MMDVFIRIFDKFFANTLQPKIAIFIMKYFSFIFWLCSLFIPVQTNSHKMFVSNLSMISIEFSIYCNIAYIYWTVIA